MWCCEMYIELGRRKLQASKIFIILLWNRVKLKMRKCVLSKTLIKTPAARMITFREDYLHLVMTAHVLISTLRSLYTYIILLHWDHRVLLHSFKSKDIFVSVFRHLSYQHTFISHELARSDVSWALKELYALLQCRYLFWISNYFGTSKMLHIFWMFGHTVHLPCC